MDKLTGLTAKEAEIKLQEAGPNTLPEKPPTSDIKIFISQLTSPLIYILFIAAGISFFLKDFGDGLVILFAVTVNTVLGFYQERKAEKGLAALKSILTPHAKVLRGGIQQEIEVKYIVPGDIVIIASGDKVPADGWLFEASHLTINEAVLTGESIPVTKSQISNIKSQKEKEKIDKSRHVFMGTTVLAGVGKFVVTKTGIETEFGRIAQSLSETEEEPTPLQKRFEKLAQVLTWVVVASALFIFITGFLRHEPLAEIFTTSVAVAVAAIPEGLVIALTTILALGMQRLLKRKALVRKLLVAETLGTVTVIATDKTGTLTEGKLQVVKTDFTNKVDALKASTYANQLLDPLEHALWEWLTSQKNFDPEEQLAFHPKKDTLPFESDHKFSATVYDHGIYVLGAPEVLLEKSTLSAAEKAKIEKKIENWAREGLRVLAVGMKKVRSPIKTIKHTDVDKITFLGLIGFADPVRVSVKDALALCRGAGIKVKVVTGDYRWTAESVLRSVGIKLSHPDTEIIEGEELEHMDDEELRRKVQTAVLFARVTPGQKLRIVDALKKQGEVVALLGDGVNDAPALKRSDIGIVVGEASDVAKETADVVLLNSNFATIVAAVEEGRAIFVNIGKVMTYLLGDTFAEVTLIFLALITGNPLPLTAAQILWINLVTDTFPTLALTVEKKEKDLLTRPPIPPSLPILGKSMIGFILTASFASGITIFLLFLYILRTTGDLKTAQLVAFTAFSIKSLVYVFSLRDSSKSIVKIALFSNPWLWLAVGVSLSLQLIAIYTPFLHELLGTRILTLKEWESVIGVSFGILLLIEIAKVIRKLLRDL